MAVSIKRSKSLAVSVERRMCWVDSRNMTSGEPVWPTPMKAIGAQNLLTMPGGVTVSGYLHKRGGKQLQLFKWPLRYVIVHKGCVYYFKTSTSASSQGAFSLNGYNRVMRAAEETTSSNVFPFKMVHISKKHRTWYFSAASEDERKKWMLALRREIDHFHDKKETITDLSDSASDSDSFYGSVERPVAINYVHNPADDSWQNDEDDDEDDYLEPDGIEDGAPSYPPPPVPRLPKGEDTPKRHSIPNQVPKPKSPIPPAKMPDSDSTRNSTIQPYKFEIDRMPPPIPTFAPAHRGSGPKPPPPLPPPGDKPLPPPPRRESASSVSSATKQPSFPPFRQSDSPATSGSTRSPANYQPSEAKHSSVQQVKFGSSSVKEELINILKNGPPPLVPQKPAVPSTEKISSKPSQISPPPPLPPVKPPALSESIKSNHAPPIPPSKPRTIGQQSLTKPPAVAARSQRPPLTSLSDKPGFPPPMRLPPDGQSFIDKTVESPIRSKVVEVDESDSDDDYEKVPLPASVYVDTCDSGDVEKMFKAADARGSPLNGLFCIRNSSTKTGKVIVVWDKQDGKTRNYRIYEKDCKVYLEAEIQFTDVATLVEHYYGKPLPGHDTLVLKYAYGCSNNPR
ncbi:SH3 domain-binding protein 2 isoform X2 [Hyperolius riggenbachi]|uniref:SH3 domain-binding protein 2 isoform X2 n=1 Tax=Hyperolius riggenbachi TaxID=752182 RepID=UPI0035A35754